MRSEKEEASMSVILSIRPRHAQAIMDGTKRFEFRRRIFKNTEIDTAYIYVTSPVQKIVGMIVISRIIETDLPRLWKLSSKYSGLEKEEFLSYFEGLEKGFAIEIGCVKVFDDPIDPKIILPGFIPPQSFCYSSAEFEE
jgi:predicted transcriptional regulator